MDRLVPTWSLLDDLKVGDADQFSAARVIEQRRLMLEVDTCALRHKELAELLNDAIERAAKGVAAPMGKIMALQPDGGLLIIAGSNLQPGVVGTVKVRADNSNPAGQCICERKIVKIRDLRNTSFDLPPVFARHGVLSSINIPIVLQSGPFGVLEIDPTEPRDYDVL